MKIKFIALVLAVFIQSLSAQQIWTETSLSTNAQWYGIACSADGSKMVTEDSGSSYGVWVSTNSGVNWQQADAPTNGGWVCSAVSADGTKMMVVDHGSSANDGAGYGIWISTNSGVNWTNSSAPANPWFSIACSADGSKWAAVENGGVYTSTNSGTTWTQQTNAPNSSQWRGICSSADGTKLAAVFNDDANLGIIISTNSGVTWKQVSALTNANWQIVTCTPDGVKLAANGNGVGIWTSTDAGMTWTRTTAPDIGWFCIATSADGKRLAACSEGTIYLSIDGGMNWIQQTNQPADGAIWQSIASSADGGVVVAANSGSGIYITKTNIPPRLNAASANGNLTVSWIIPSQAYALQQNPNLTSSTWPAVTNTPLLNLTNLQNQVSVPKSSVNNGFYRLQSQ